MQFKVGALSLSLVFVACSSTPYHQTNQVSASEAAFAGVQNKPIVTRLKKVQDMTKPLSLGERLAPHGFTLGAWVDRSAGALFQQVPAQGNNVAIVYLYRPSSNWNYQEIIAPSFFLNGERLAGLRNNQYYWLELPAGEHQLSIRRPLGFTYFQKGTLVNFKVEAGKHYYLRYDEEGTRGKVDPALGLLSVGPIQQVPEKTALPEISETTLNTPGYSFVPPPDTIVQSEFNQFTGKKPTAVPRARLQAKEDVALGVPFKIWNPLTW